MYADFKNFIKNDNLILVLSFVISLSLLFGAVTYVNAGVLDGEYTPSSSSSGSSNSYGNINSGIVDYAFDVTETVCQKNGASYGDIVNVSNGGSVGSWCTGIGCSGGSSSSSSGSSSGGGSSSSSSGGSSSSSGGSSSSSGSSSGGGSSSGKGGGGGSSSSGSSGGTPYVPSNCSLSGITIPHGGSYTFYSTPNVAYNDSCPRYAQTRTCNDGTLSGSALYTNPSCSVLPPPEISEISIKANPPIVSSGGSSTIRWDGGNSENCTVAGTNFSASGVTGSKIAFDIQEATTYTLTCTLSYRTKTAQTTVVILPVWNEF